jgi:hypothetical protein
MQSRQTHGIAAVGLHTISRALRYQRRRDNDAVMAHCDNLAMEIVARRPGFVEKVKPGSSSGQLVDHRPH